MRSHVITGVDLDSPAARPLVEACFQARVARRQLKGVTKEAAVRAEVAVFRPECQRGLPGGYGPVIFLLDARNRGVVIPAFVVESMSQPTEYVWLHGFTRRIAGPRGELDLERFDRAGYLEARHTDPVYAFHLARVCACGAGVDVPSDDGDDPVPDDLNPFRLILAPQSYYSTRGSKVTRENLGRLRICSDDVRCPTCGASAEGTHNVIKRFDEPISALTLDRFAELEPEAGALEWS